MSSKTKRKEIDITGQFRPSFQIKDWSLTNKQRELVRLIRDENTKVIFISGPAGVSKTFIATFCALLALRENSIEKIKYLRSLVENSSAKIGFLPGDTESKLYPYSLSLIDQLEQFLDKHVYEQLLRDEVIEVIPTNFLRGRTFKNQYVLVDEIQNCSFSEIVTIISRIGEGSKFIFMGDAMQSDIKSNGMSKIIKAFNDDESREHGIHTFEFTSEDVVRSKILMYIMSKLEKSHS